ncbi:MAG: hypothetical protein ACXV8J_05480 [Methylobacter sp.]
MTGGSQLAHQHDVQRRVDHPGDLESHWNSAAGQGEDDHIRTLCIFSQCFPQQASGLDTVFKWQFQDISLGHTHCTVCYKTLINHMPVYSDNEY